MPRYEVTLRFSGESVSVHEADDPYDATEYAILAYRPRDVQAQAVRVVEVDAYEGESRGTD